MKVDLSDQIILVTGASRGIGRSIALELAKCGAKVALHYFQNKNAVEAVQKEIGKKATLFQADLSKAIEVSTLFNAVVTTYGRIDGVVNNSGVAIASSIQDNDLEWVESWMNTIDLNLNAVGMLCKKAIEHFCSHNNPGRIVNIASRAAFRGETESYLAYAASKGGVVALTKSIAKSFGKYNIKAFVIAPGFVETDMAKSFENSEGEALIDQDRALTERTTPLHVAPIVAFLFSGLSDHATGTTIDINAGSYMH